jgi:hypothetical protein
MNTSAQLIRALKGPLLLIVLGFLFVIDHSGGLDFSQTWPVLIILFGVMKLIERMMGSGEPQPPPPQGAGTPPGFGGSGWSAPPQPPAAAGEGGQGGNQ